MLDEQKKFLKHCNVAKRHDKITYNVFIGFYNMSREKRAEYQMGKHYIRKREVWTFFVIFLTVLCMLKTVLADVGGVCCGTDKFDHSYVLNGNGPHDIIAVAEKQAGKGQNALGYTDAWCAAFVNDCAKLAGQSDAIPFVSGVTHGVDGLYREVKKRGGQSVSSVQKGDLVFYYCSECGCFYHVGIMIDANKSIEGNFGGANVYIYDWWSDNTRSEYPTEEEQRQYDYWDWFQNVYNVRVIRTALSDGADNPAVLANVVYNCDDTCGCRGICWNTAT